MFVMIKNMKSLFYSAQQEEKIEIPIPNTTLHINGILRGGWDKPLAILLHGLPGSNRGILSFLGAKLLAEAGISTLRINLYDEGPDTRDMVDCLLQTHADDFDTIVDYVREKGTPKIMAAGHSYGGLTILRSKAKLDSAVLWDPSHFKCSREYDDERYKQRHLLLEDEGLVVFLEGRGYLDPLPMVKEREKYMNVPAEELAKKNYPILFIAAGKSNLPPYIREYYEVARDPKKMIVIDDASHSFEDTDEILFKVFSETIDWFKRR